MFLSIMLKAQNMHGFKFVELSYTIDTELIIHWKTESIPSEKDYYFVIDRTDGGFNIVDIVTSNDRDIIREYFYHYFYWIKYEHLIIQIARTSDLINFYYSDMLYIDSPMLPVELVAFNVYGDKILTFEWITASEYMCDYFQVIRLHDNQESVLFTEYGNGNSSLINKYKITVDNVFTGDNYFKLLQYDFDGNEHMLGIKYVRCNDYIISERKFYSENLFRFFGINGILLHEGTEYAPSLYPVIAIPENGKVIQF